MERKPPRSNRPPSCAPTLRHNAGEKDAVHLETIAASIADIEHYSAEAGWAQNSMARDAVCLKLIVIGEAAKEVSAKTRLENGAVPWKDIIGLRNRIAHNYQGVRTGRLQNVVTDHLPALKHNINQILVEHAQQSGKNLPCQR